MTPLEKGVSAIKQAVAFLSADSGRYTPFTN